MDTQFVKFKEYETIYILRSDVDADTADKVQGKVNEVITREQGKLIKVEQWGRRKLAYIVAKQRRGVYVYVKFAGRGNLVTELERNLKLQDSVLKWQTVSTADLADIASVAVDPEEIKFHRMELEAEPEEAESRERALGLVDLGPDAPRARREEEDEFEAEEVEAPAAAAAKKEGEEA